MTPRPSSIRWYALSIACFAVAILAEPLLRTAALWPAGLPGGVSGPVWGTFTGAAIWALLNGMGRENMRRRDPGNDAPRVSRLRLAFWLILAFGLILTVLSAAQFHVLDLPILSGVMFNPALLASMIALAILFPTQAQGLFLPVGDERFCATQQRAQALTMRLAILLCTAGAALTWYRAPSLPVPVLLYGGLTLLVATYAGLLWRIEAAAGTDP